MADRRDAGDDVTPTLPESGLPTGTLVLTPAGERPVEALSTGDLVIAVSGTAAPFQRVADIRRVALAGPLVRIRAGALADGAPRQDLLVPAGQGLLLDGALVGAGALVDGLGIVAEATEPGREAILLLLAGHDAVLAEGAAVETGLPSPDAAPCLPRAAPGGPLLALLGWRAEAMGWSSRDATPEPAPAVGTLRERLSAFPLTPAMAPALPLRPPR
ncbi:Hint domain-containing protein [Roseomonas sp. HF4]|uniref:Hint domain-containing protein n=1 Tax=Roseomonas sp. HF4 TaxID=2562313 RepID=UPI0010C01A98|nr:Hint domain-containing protein [Roseomonas sp. HF4]